MSLEEILFDPRFRLPLEKPEKEKFYTFLNSLFDDYIAALKANPDFLNNYKSIQIDEDAFINKVVAIADMIKKILSLRTSESYRTFEHLMKSAFMILYDHKYCQAQIDEGAYFYRCVQSATTEKKSRFFHASFDMPEVLAPTRFTAAGFPSLYLTNSLSAGYLESRTSKIDDFQAVKFENKIRLNLIDLDYTLGDGSDEQQGLKQQRLGVLYPLYAACFVIYKDTDKNPQEYRIPGFLLEWVSAGKGLSFNGILYASTKTAAPAYTDRFYNLVIPPLENLTEGWCPFLKDRAFHMSEVCHWPKHEPVIEDYFVAEYAVIGEINKDVRTIPWPDEHTVCPYPDTELGRMEFFMRYHDDMVTKEIDF